VVSRNWWSFICGGWILAGRNGGGYRNVVGFLCELVHMAGAAGAWAQRFGHFFCTEASLNVAG